MRKYVLLLILGIIVVLGGAFLKLQHIAPTLMGPVMLAGMVIELFAIIMMAKLTLRRNVKKGE